MYRGTNYLPIAKTSYTGEANSHKGDQVLVRVSL
jgi:hypothetical protein